MTTAVVCAAFDPTTDAVIGQLRDRVDAAGHRARRNHRPHLTLAAARAADVEPIVSAAEAVAARHNPFTLAMESLDSFPSGVLFAAPAESDDLRALQRDAHDTLVTAGWPSAFGARTDPEHWTPHCTLATGLAPPAVRTLRATPIAAVEATVDALVIIVVGGRGDVARLPLGPVATGARITP